jgi:hypothetical protein
MKRNKVLHKEIHYARLEVNKELPGLQKLVKTRVARKSIIYRDWRVMILFAIKIFARHGDFHYKILCYINNSQ